MNTGEAFDQRGLARAVLPEQRVHLARFRVKSTSSSALTPGNSIEMPLISRTTSCKNIIPSIVGGFLYEGAVSSGIPGFSKRPSGVFVRQSRSKPAVSPSALNEDSSLRLARRPPSVKR